MPYYTILLLKFTEPSRASRGRTKDILNRFCPFCLNCMVVVFHGDLIVLLPSGSGNRFAKQEEPVRCLPTAKPHAGHVSYPYTDIAKSSIYWRQVKELSLLHEKPAFPKDRHFIYYEQYYLEHGFCQYKDTGLLAASVHPVITQMTGMVPHQQHGIRQDTRVYLAKNRNALAAAGNCISIKSTFFYRLGKMADPFGIDTE